MPHRRARRHRAGLRAAAGLAVVAAAVVSVAGCGAGADGSRPTWTPAPSFSRDGLLPGDPAGGDPGAPHNGQSGPSPGIPTAPTSPSRRGGGLDPNVVAARLAAPTGLTLLPDGSALVGERTTGRIVRVQPQPRRPVHTVRTIPGISTVGGGGLLDLALSPNYAEDQLIFAYITTPRDNRVITFTLHGPITSVLTGIPRGRTDNAGRIAFDAHGNLLITTGAAGRPALAADPRSLAGKVLRVTDIGRPAPNNPTPGRPQFAAGLEYGNALCVDPTNDLTVVAESRSGPGGDAVYAVRPGARLGWPRPSPINDSPLGAVPAADRAPGGCALQDGDLYVTSLDGEALLSAPIRTVGALVLGPWRVALRQRYGRLRTVVAAPDGALWLTTSNRDGHGTPIPADERVLRIVAASSGAGGAKT